MAKSVRSKLRNIIFTTNGRTAYLFDVWLLIFILLSCLLVFLESVPSIHAEYGLVLYILEWFFTIAFTIEYILRIYSAKNRLKYMTSWWGIIDVLAILPTFIGIFNPNLAYLRQIRVLRLIRVFRVFKLKKYVTGGNIMMIALSNSRPKIISFVLFVVLVATVLGSVMYVIEGQGPGFETIPDSIYWSIITLTTVGYGNVVPATILGKMIATFIMILGYGIIAVPTGIVSAEMAKQKHDKTED
ncbi:MAG: ion transporter [Flavobacteriales bacterium]|nr:ion transporter [Flavobacteriales bacterium]